MIPRLRRSPLCIALVAALLLAGGVPTTGATPAATEQVRLYLIALGDQGSSGPLVGCGDSLVPIMATVPAGATTAARITNALTALFALRDAHDSATGLYNALYQSTLVVDRVELQGTAAAVYLSGSPNLGGVCDDPRAEGQIVATAQQFPGVQKVILIVNGGPLVDLRGPLDFPETGYFIAQPFSVFWETQGGLPIFGYPLTNQLAEGGYLVQYFERQRLEYHPEERQEYRILLGLVGRQSAERRGLLSTAPFASARPRTEPGCEYFTVTGHSVCDGFATYWHRYGLDFGEPGISFRESLALFGYPLSETFPERLEDGKVYYVQYFERVRMEYHPQNRYPYDVLLGRLTADLIPSSQR